MSMKVVFFQAKFSQLGMAFISPKLLFLIA